MGLGGVQMSRIGLAPIEIPKGVEINIDKGNYVTVKGPKGELARKLAHEMDITVEDSVIKISRPTDQKHHRALHGLTRALLNNMVVGVTTGFEKRLDLVGVGYRVASFTLQTTTSPTEANFRPEPPRTLMHFSRLAPLLSPTLSMVSA
jgi:ribosomal protein L6P/L9E